MFERFTERARQVIVLAQDEARALNHAYIGTEHLLLGMLREQEGLAARVLETFDVGVEDTRARILGLIPAGDEPVIGQIPFSPRGKKVLELALREGLSLGHNYIGTEHLLLGLLRERKGVAIKVLEEQGLSVEQIRSEILRQLVGPRAIDPVSYGGAVSRLRLTHPIKIIPARGRYEHRVLALDPKDPLRGVEESAAEGWELMAVTEDPEGGESPIAYLRRPERRERNGRPGRRRPQR